MIRTTTYLQRIELHHRSDILLPQIQDEEGKSKDHLKKIVHYIESLTQNENK